MDIKINGKTFEVPFSLSLITLSQCIEYYERFGENLEKERMEIESKIQGFPEIDQLIELENFIDKTALAWYSFWTGFDLFDIENEKFTEPLKNQFRILQGLLHDEDDLIENFGKEIFWKDGIWCLSDFKECSFEEMNFNQIQLLRHIFYSIEKLKKNKWDAMIYLCAIFFRKKNEPVENVLIYSPYYPGGCVDRPTIDPARVEIMKELPMNYVMSIKTLVTIMVDENITQNIFHGPLNEPIQTLAGTLINPDALERVRSTTDQWEKDIQAGKMDQVEYDSKIVNLFEKSRKKIFKQVT